MMNEGCVRRPHFRTHLSGQASSNGGLLAMYQHVRASSVLILLLVLRVLAAPIALPDSPRPQAHTALVVRVCAWPAQRALRPALAQVAGGWVRRGWGDVSADLMRAADVGLRTPPGQARVAAHTLLALADASFVHVHVSDCARC